MGHGLLRGVTKFYLKFYQVSSVGELNRVLLGSFCFLVVVLMCEIFCGETASRTSSSDPASAVTLLTRAFQSRLARVVCVFTLCIVHKVWREASFIATCSETFNLQFL